MGGAVSSGRDNNELIDNLMGGNYIRSRHVERVFRALDRAEYMTPESRDQAYKDLAWRNGCLHMSAPCIYSEVLEALDLKPGLSFLNVGSGTGYLSTLVGLIIGSSGINHGIEVHPHVLEYSVKKLGQFIENSPILDDFDFCVPKFYSGNGMCLAPLQPPYDRLYCGAGCPLEFHNYFKQLIKVGGVLVMPLSDNLVQIKRTASDGWSSRNLLNVSFASLRLPSKEEASDLLRLVSVQLTAFVGALSESALGTVSGKVAGLQVEPLQRQVVQQYMLMRFEEQCPPSLQILARAVVRESMREAHLSRNPQLREPPPSSPKAGNSCPTRICIPINDDSDVEGLNALHDLDNVNGATEMNALLSLVLSMGQNRVAGALRLDSLDSPSSSSSDEQDNGGAGDNDDNDDNPDRPSRPSPPSGSERSHRPERTHRPERLHRPERSHRSDCAERTEKSDPIDKSDSYEQTDNRRSSSEPPNDESPNRTRYAANIHLPGSIRTHSLITFEIQDSSVKNAGSSRCTAPSSSNDRQTTENSRETRRRTSMRGVPTEVEIYLGKERPSTSRSNMEWENNSEAKRETSSEEDATETSKGKRKKLDSGIGEGTTTSSGSSPAKTESNEGDESDVETGRSDTVSETETIRIVRRRRLKRNRCSTGGRGGAPRTMPPRSGGAALRRKRRGAECARGSDELRPRRGTDARRVRLSVLMKRGVKELPLPYALKKYVNLGRCFEF